MTTYVAPRRTHGNRRPGSTLRPMTPFASLRLRAETVERLRRLTRQLSVAADRDLTQSEVLGYLLDLAEQHAAQLAETVKADGNK
jgi:hypothetical protein